MFKWIKGDVSVTRETKAIGIYTNILFISKELVHFFVGTGKYESCKSGQQIGNSGRS